MIHRFSLLVSTNDEARRMADAGAPHGTAIVADRQTGGRGRQGRVWFSLPGNLHASVILRPPDGARRSDLAFIAGLAAADAVTPLPATLKWPNDVLLDGSKVAGVLIEGQTPGPAIAGIGINVASAPPDLPSPATAMAQHGVADREAVLTALLAALDRWWAVWLAGGFAPVREAWLRRGPPLGQPITVRQEFGTLMGRFAGLDADGALLMDADGKRHRIVAGDVR